jgi:outer membrane lipoprotein-sorting protein
MKTADAKRAPASATPSPREARRGSGRGVCAPLLTLALTAACCAHAQPTVRPYQAPTADALLATLTARQAAVRGMNARVRATSWLDGERVRATVNMLVQRDGHLRFEAEVSLQGMVAALATDGTTFAFFDAHKNEVSRGPACPENVASLIRIPLAPADVAALLLGDARLPEGAVPQPVQWDAASGSDLLVMRARDERLLVYTFRGSSDVDRALVGVTSLDKAGKRAWRAAFEDLENAGGVRLPGTIRFAEHDASFDDGVEIKFKDRALNAPPAANAFTLAPPAGVTIVEVGCGTAPR